jgi:hypothetical protein
MIDRPGDSTLRERLRADYASARAEVLSIFASQDPMSLGGLPDEYGLEVDLILPRLRKARSVADVPPILHEIFHHCFGVPPNEDLTRYDEISAAVWEAWQRYPLIHDPHYKLTP